MSKLGFYFFLNERDMVFNCPHCKTSNHYINAGQNEDVFTNLTRDTNFSVVKLKKMQFFNRANTIDGGEITEKTINIPACDNKPMNYTCPNCGIKHRSYYYSPFLGRREENTPFYLKSSVSEDYKRVQMSIMGMVYTFFNERVQARYYMTRIVFNKATGRVSIMRPLDPDNKPSKLFYSYPRIWNVTYGNIFSRADLYFVNDDECSLKEEFRTNFLPRVLKALQVKFPYIKDTHFDECFEPSVSTTKSPNGLAISATSSLLSELRFCDVLTNTVRKFRFHDFELDFLKTINNVSGEPKAMKALSRIGFNSKQQVTDYYRMLPKDTSKSVRKLALRSYEMLFTIRSCTFIQSSQNRIKLLESSATSTNNMDTTQRFYSFYMPFLLTVHQNNFRDEDKLYQYCETLLTNRIINTSHYLLQDTMSMYKQIQRIEHDGDDIEINTSLSIKDLHDYLTKAYNSLRFKNYQINYTEEEREIEWRNERYMFKLANDSDQLREVGRKMNICVGSYSDRAVNRELTIVIVSSEEEDNECCIELTGDMIAINQAKINRNRRPEGELLKAIWDWVKDKDLVVHTPDMYSPEKQEEYYDNLTEVNAQITVRRRLYEARQRAANGEQFVDIEELEIPPVEDPHEFLRMG